MKKQTPPFALAFCLCGLAFYLMLTGCAGPAPDTAVEVDSEFSRSMRAGRLAFDQGLIEQAARFYQQALSRARAMDSATQIGDAAYNLAACRIGLNQLEKARDLLDEAKTEISRIQGNIADIQLVEAKVARLQGNPEEASMLADQVLSSPNSHPGDNLRLQVYLLRGQIACDKDDAAMALRELQMAKKVALDVPLGDQMGQAALLRRFQLSTGLPELGRDPLQSQRGIDLLLGGTGSHAAILVLETVFAEA